MTESLTSLTESEISTPAVGPASRVTLTLISSMPTGVNDCVSQLKTLSQPMVQSLKVCNLPASNIERMIVETERAIGSIEAEGHDRSHANELRRRFSSETIAPVGTPLISAHFRSFSAVTV